MAFSGTVSQTDFNTRKVIETGFRRCKIPAEQITPEYVEIANNALYLWISELASQGVPLWCIENQIYPIYDGVGQIETPQGTVDILNANLRTPMRVTGSDTTTATEYETDFTDETFVTMVGVLWDGASVPIAIERSDDGVTWETIQSESPEAVAGQWTWYDLDSSVAAQFIRVRATSGVLTFTEIFWGNNPYEIPLYRMSRDTYTQQSNRFFQSNRPLQYWLDRRVNRPIMRFYPVPNDAAIYYQIVVWVQRNIMDIGTMTQSVEVPQRWFEALCSGLAAKLAMEIIEVDPALVPILDAKADRAMQIAQAEERDNSPEMIQPDISMYTR